MCGMRTHHRLFLSYSLLVAAVVVILIVGVDATLRRPLLERAGAELLRELALGREIYDAAVDEEPDMLARRLSRTTGHRVTIIAPDGVVLGDSDVPARLLGELENHAAREEVRAALETGSGTAIRRSSSVGFDFLYAATRTGRGDVLRFAEGTETIDSAVAAVRRQVLVVGAAALLLAALFSLGFSFAITRRLRRMRRVAATITAGDLTARIRPRQQDELGELGMALDSLAEELQHRLGQLEAERQEMAALIDAMAEGVLALGPDGAVRRANPAARAMFDLPAETVGLAPEEVARGESFREIVHAALAGTAVPPTELRHERRQLLATAQPLPRGGAVLVFLDMSEVRRLEGVRRDFVANASHELKTPLTAIRGYSETLLDDGVPDELRRRFMASIHANAERLQNILDDLLDLTQIESGGWTMEPQPLVVADVVADAWQQFADDAARKGVELAIELAGGSDDVVADRRALRQVFTNLFSNALRHTPAGGLITVHAAPAEAGWTRLAVRDTGSGIAPQHLDRIFERFYRADPARSRAEGGTGLGLAIVRHIVERHGGSVEAESRVGAGTTIRFTLPARVAVPHDRRG
jgi:two-component system, OmpR family, phosphate regulon sensor histidine kinase PhoR